MPKNDEPIVTVKTRIATEAMEYYVQKVLDDHFDELRDKIKAEIKEQFGNLDLEAVIKDAMRDIVKNEITKDVQEAWRQAWWNDRLKTTRDKVRKVIAEQIALTLTDEVIDG